MSNITYILLCLYHLLNYEALLRYKRTDGISEEMLKLGGEAMIPYLARLFDITLNNGTLPADWKRAIMAAVHKGGDRSFVTNYRPVSLT